MGTDIAFDGTGLAVTEPGVFRPGRRRLGSALIEYLASRPEVRAARLDLQTGTCYFELTPETRTLGRMADAFVAGIRAALKAERPLARRERNWTELYVQRTTSGLVFLEAVRHGTGHWTVRLAPDRGWPRIDGEIFARLRSLPGVCGITTLRWSHGFEIQFEPVQLGKDRPLGAVARALQIETAEESNQALPSDFVASGPRRLLYLAAGCGSFAMMFVGLIVPGVPTVPFLLASGYCFARSSRPLHRKLLQSRLFGQMLREWETCRAMSGTSKRRLVSFTLAVIAVTVAFAPLSPAVVWIVILLSGASLYSIAQIPQIESQTNRRLEVIG